MRISDYIDADLLDRFEFYNYNHAIEIITQAFPKEWSDVVECLRKLDITTDDLREAGGNETKIPKKFDDVLYPCGWREIRISGDLHIKFYPRQADQRGRFSSVPFEERVTENYSFFRCAADVIHGTDPCHLIFSFHLLGDPLRLCHLLHQQLQHLSCLPICLV